MLTRPFVVTGVTQSGALSIPVGSRCWGVSVQSGVAFVNGFPLLAGVPINVGLPDSKDILGYPILVSGAGSGASATVFWVQ